MAARAQPFFAEEKKSQKGRLEKEGKDALHRKRLPDHPARCFREFRPVRAELKFHRNARNDTQREADSENLRPKPGSAIPFFIPVAQGDRLDDEDQQREPHRELRKNVMERDGEGELQAVNC